MKLQSTLFYSLVAITVLHVPGFAESLRPELITQAQADAVVESRIAKKAEANARLRQQLNSMTVIEENVLKTPAREMIVRRVAPPEVEVPEPDQISKNPAPVSKALDGGFQLTADLRDYDAISVSAQVFNGAYSKVLWPDAETGQTFEIWTNFNMLYLNPLSSFETGQTHYSYFAMVEKIDRRGERRRRKNAAKMGYPYHSRWQRPPVKLSRKHPEYVVVTEAAAAVPEKLYRQMDDLFAYYLAEFDALEITYKNSEKLRKAHERFTEEHPPQAEPSITIFWPGKNSSYQTAQ